MHHHHVVLACERQHGIELWPLGVFPRRLVDELLVHLYIIELALRVLVETADPDITDALPEQDVFPSSESVRKTL